LNDLYKEDIQKYIDYNLNDVFIVVALDNKFKYIELAREICHVGHIPYEWFHMSSRYLEGAILMDLRRNKLVAPNKPLDCADDIESLANKNNEDDDDDDDEGFEGAYVKHPVPGRYDWLYDLDLSSMYPNIIITLNISPETKIGKIQSVKLTDAGTDHRVKKLKHQYSELDDKIKKTITESAFVGSKMHEFDSECFAQNSIVSVNLGGVDYSGEKLKSILVDDNLSISSNGVIYSQAEKGVIPKLLSHWFDQRKQMRKLSKKYHDENNRELEDYYDRKQYSWKILLNSMYGTLGLPVFRFYDIDNASAVTATGVIIIQTTGKLINQYYRGITGTNDDYVIYQDTDSCFVSAVPVVLARDENADVSATEDNKQMVTSILDIASEVQNYINTAYSVMAKRMFNVTNHTLEIKQEIISTTGVWLAKKRYAQWRINENGKYIREDSKKLEIKGLDIVRTGFPMKFRGFLKEILIMVLSKKDKSEIDSKILEFRSQLPNFSALELAKNTSVKFKSGDGKINFDPKSRQPFSVIDGSTAQTKASLYYNDLLKMFGLDKTVEKIYSGSKIKWVYLRRNPYNIDNLAFKADGTDPQEILDIINTYMDRKKIYEKELHGKLKDFYKVLGWEVPSQSSVKAAQFFS
jgi:DNA polymerase elongation subunit (family B)